MKRCRRLSLKRPMLILEVQVTATDGSHLYKCEHSLGLRFYHCRRVISVSFILVLDGWMPCAGLWTDLNLFRLIVLFFPYLFLKSESNLFKINHTLILCVYNK